MLQGRTQRRYTKLFCGAAKVGQHFFAPVLGLLRDSLRSCLNHFCLLLSYDEFLETFPARAMSTSDTSLSFRWLLPAACFVVRVGSSSLIFLALPNLVNLGNFMPIVRDVLLRGLGKYFFVRTLCVRLPLPHCPPFHHAAVSCAEARLSTFDPGRSWVDAASIPGVCSSETAVHFFLQSNVILGVLGVGGVC